MLFTKCFSSFIFFSFIFTSSILSMEERDIAESNPEKVSSFNTLPEEIQFMILSHLELPELAKASTTASIFNKVFHEEFNKINQAITKIKQDAIEKKLEINHLSLTSTTEIFAPTYFIKYSQPSSKSLDIQNLSGFDTLGLSNKEVIRC